MAATDFVTETQVDSLTTNIATAVKANATAIALNTDDTTVDNHVGDTADAHDASAISVLDTATDYTADNVEAALAEVKVIADANAADTTASDHISDATGAHAATAVSFADVATDYAADNVEAALAEVKVIADANAADTTASDHVADATDAHDASAISFLDTADDYTAVDVEAALAEVRVVADAAAGGGVAINDGLTNSTDAWSSQKITDYTAAGIAALVDSSPGTLDTLNELAAAIGDDANFATTMTTALGNRLRIDTAAQGLTAQQKADGLTNLGIVASSQNFAGDFNTGIA
jgi:hypothetical protein